VPDARAGRLNLTHLVAVTHIDRNRLSKGQPVNALIAAALVAASVALAPAAENPLTGEWKVRNDIASNVSETTTVVRGQVERLDATVTDIVDRTRLQVIRADELLNRTMDRIEETSDVVHRTVVSPVRQLSGIIQGLTAGLEFLLGGERRRRHDVSVPQDEMFI